MTNLEAYILLILLYGFLLFEIIFVFYWYHKNKYIIKFYELKDGAFLKHSKRCRLVTFKVYDSKNPLNLFRKVISSSQKFCKMWDIKRVPLPINYEDVKDNFYILESNPVIGAKLGLNIIKKWNNYESFRPEFILTNDELIINTTLVWISQAREELYEYTKMPETKGELLLKIALPIGLIILAIIMIIFFPKIYETVAQGGNSALAQSVSNWNSLIEQFIPKG